MTKQGLCIFVFHRDLRLYDNRGLALAAQKFESILPVFIFTGEQVTNRNPFLSRHSVQFMIESLDDLNNKLRDKGGRLYCFSGNTKAVLADLVKHTGAKGICFNNDITPYAKARDKEIADMCEKQGIECLTADDCYLLPPGSVTKDSCKTENCDPTHYYHKFTPFYTTFMRQLKKDDTKETTMSAVQWATYNGAMQSINDAYLQFSALNPNIKMSGGRANALQRLRNKQTNYEKTRNILADDTSLLSADLKFGCLSVREVYNAYRGNHAFIRQLVWRDFYAHLLFIHPEMLDPSKKTLRVVWTHNKGWLDAWKSGQTGFPVVDACMHQINTCGYMHNRGRMIVASFLVKTLLIDWREGERYFAQKLVDYDVASNNGNWRWIAGDGVTVDGRAIHFDSQPYFRIMNPWIQSANFDKDGEYIKKWMPSLSQVDARDLHKWYDEKVRAKYPELMHYKPIVDYSVQKQRVLAAYKP